MTKPTRIEELAALADQVADASSILLEAMGALLETGQALQAINQRIITLAKEEDQRRETYVERLAENVVNLRPRA